MTKRFVDESPEIRIYDVPTEANIDHYGHAWGVEVVALTDEHLAALSAGNMLAMPINVGEYNLFIAHRDALLAQEEES